MKLEINKEDRIKLAADLLNFKNVRCFIDINLVTEEKIEPEEEKIPDENFLNF